MLEGRCLKKEGVWEVSCVRKGKVTEGKWLQQG